MKENKSKWKLDSSMAIGLPIFHFWYVNDKNETLTLKDRIDVPENMNIDVHYSSFMDATQFENGNALVALGQDAKTDRAGQLVAESKIIVWLLIDEDGHIICQFKGKDKPFVLGNNYVGLNQEGKLIFHEISSKKNYVCDDRLVENLTNCIKRVKKFKNEAEKEKHTTNAL